jgi:hypothetical protein
MSQIEPVNMTLLTNFGTHASVQTHSYSYLQVTPDSLSVSFSI